MAWSCAPKPVASSIRTNIFEQIFSSRAYPHPECPFNGVEQVEQWFFFCFCKTLIFSFFVDARQRLGRTDGRRGWKGRRSKIISFYKNKSFCVPKNSCNQQPQSDSKIRIAIYRRMVVNSNCTFKYNTNSKL